ncbi:MAG: Nine-heme cytochrome C [Desulfovibrionaceae bacterium]|nr:Nine-heme cytochrome C [Desulfovibrionaceae bacterium]
MRNRTKLLLLAAFALAGAACLLFRGPDGTMAAKAPELTDSGALPVQVLFPVSAKPNPGAVGMKPVVFTHKLHESKVQNCETCHHTGDPVPCTTCHTVEGCAEGNFVTLERAMHATNIRQVKNGRTPESCVSCHTKLYSQRKECAGCHSIVKPNHNAQWCAVCHQKVPNMTQEQFAKGVAGKLDPMEGMRLAEATIAARKEVKYADPTKMNYRMVIDSLVDKYEPNYFNHARHIVSVERKIKGNLLAKAFHNSPRVFCKTCHHHTPALATPPKCVSCHNSRIDKKYPGRPPLKAAYHLQCMGCHDGMQVKRPRKTDCTGCHKLRVAQKGD